MKKSNTIFSILKIYAVVLGIFSIFRLILFFTELDRVDFQEVSLFTVARAFVMGVRFDVVISGYIIFFPALALLVFEIIGRKSNIIKKIIFYWLLVLFSIAFVIAAIDIPYFNHFFARLSMSAFQWMDSPAFVFGMIMEEPAFFLAVIPLGLSVYVFAKLLRRIFANGFVRSNGNIYVKGAVAILFLAVIFIGIRGRLDEKSPIRIGTAYFGSHAFLNQMGLNPVFTLLRSFLDSLKEENRTVHLMDDDLAIEMVQEALGIEPDRYVSPIARDVIYNNESDARPNIVLIIMERMSSAKMGRHSTHGYVSPFLDSISHQSYYFDNIYTAGKHTFNGVFSTLFSFPALYQQHSMKSIKHFDGIAETLKKRGYSTTYFTTHDGQFDNIEGFLRANGFDNVISKANYPDDEVKTTMGVPDDFMFRYSIPVLNQLHSNNKPFFASFMTASDHSPYYLPEYFQPTTSGIERQMVEYADWSLQKFIHMASREDWFENTIFVFIADHGFPIFAPYDISLDYHHTPLIFYAPGILPEAKTFHGIGGQIDVFPTIMGLLGQSYVNNTLGIDLLREERPFIFVNDDDKIGIIGDSLFLIMMDGRENQLLKYRNFDQRNYITQFPRIAQEMLDYTRSNMQVFQYMLLNEQSLNVLEH